MNHLLITAMNVFYDGIPIANLIHAFNYMSIKRFHKRTIEYIHQYQLLHPYNPYKHKIIQLASQIILQYKQDNYKIDSKSNAVFKGLMKRSKTVQFNLSASI